MAREIAETLKHTRMIMRLLRERAVTSRVSPLGRTEDKIFLSKKLLSTLSTVSLSEENLPLKSSTASSLTNSVEKRLFSVKVKEEFPELKEFPSPLITKLALASLLLRQRISKTLKSWLLRTELSSILPTEKLLSTRLFLTTSEPPISPSIITRKSVNLKSTPFPTLETSSVSRKEKV
jgi:hypothetical protein